MNKTLIVTFLVVLLAIVVIVAAVALFLIWRNRKRKGETPSEISTTALSQAAIHSAFRDAQRILDRSVKLRGARITALPAFILIGPQGSGKTSLMERSGIERELLAGQIRTNADILPTSGINIWLARETLFVEMPAAGATDPTVMHALLKHLMAGGFSAVSSKSHAPRGFVLSIDQTAIAGAPVADDVVGLARPWNECITRAASLMGTQLPVYVVLTNTDRSGGFAEFCSNLGTRDLNQAFGATIIPFKPSTGGVYAQEMTDRLNFEFAQIQAALCDCRVPVLNREHDRLKIAMQYQFPRDFQKKLQNSLVQFLVEVVRPSPLHASPFLRGFYFTGIRKVAVDPAETRDPTPSSAPYPSYVGATSVMSIDQLRAQSSLSEGSEAGSREMIEWLFAKPLLERVIQADRSGHGAAVTSTRTDRLRALGITVFSLLGIFLIVALTVSFIRNRNLEKALLAGASARTPYERVRQLRAPVNRLLDSRASSPDMSMRWGLYSGGALLPGARAAYCSAMTNDVLTSVFQQMQDHLASHSSDASGRASNFAYLKAYMMMTTNPEKAESSFLGQQLFDVWTNRQSGPVNAEAATFLPAEFQTYGALLGLPGQDNPCILHAAPGLIPASQLSLRSLNADDYYQSLLHQAGAGVAPIDYAALFPNAAVSDSKIVSGWFTQRGWAQMQQLLAHPEVSLKADAWVRGESKDLTPEQLVAMANEYRGRYYNDYVNAWKEFLAAARVNPYANLRDAAVKLETISNERSALLSLVGLATENTASIDKVKTVFQSTKAVVPALGEFQPDADYLKQLAQLKNRLAKAADSTGPAHDQDVEEVRGAATATQDSIDQIARTQGFRSETDQIVKGILSMPIVQLPAILSKQGAAAVNKAEGDLCNSYNRVAKLLPFASVDQHSSASVDDVQRIFQPEHGQMWQFYNENLRDSLDCRGADCQPKPNPKFNLAPGFVDFFRTMNRWSWLLYGGSQDLIIRLQARATPFNHVKQVYLLLDDQRVALPTDPREFQNIVWDLRKAQRLVISGDFDGVPQTQELSTADGHWALLQWLQDTESGSSGSDGFNWVPKGGRSQPRTLNNGNTLQYKLEVRLADGSERPLDLRSMNRTSCPSVAVR